MANLKVKIGNVELKNPVLPASGAFGFGYDKLFDYKKLGGIVSKGITLEPKQGNDGPRIAETPGGMINSVGLENAGIDHFAKYMIPYYKTKNDILVVNIAGHSVDEYRQIAAKLDDTKADMIEVNVSCPNVTGGGMAFGVSPSTVTDVVSSVRSATSKPIMIKLSPNVCDITEIAKACEAAGADSISLINTLLAMRIDIRSSRPLIKNNIGGLSGAAVFPIALRMVYSVAHAVSIPVVGMGGISNADQAVEMIIAGATAVQVGSILFNQPSACLDIIDGINKYLDERNISDVSSIIKSVKPW